ncbi:MAG: signal recognition particle-docking protein FtsY [Vampirovibrionales bacterium]
MGFWPSLRTNSAPPLHEPSSSTAPSGGWGQRLGAALTGLFSSQTSVDERFWEELEETLLLADVGVETTQYWLQQLRSMRGQTPNHVQQALANSIAQELLALQTPVVFDANQLTVVMVTGVNGAGKTTFIGKLAYQLHQQGYRVVIAAGDTFRAAAVEQLAVWAQRAQAYFVSKPNGDPAAVAYEALTEAHNRQANVVIVDTAGRLQNQQNLMDELKKVDGVIHKQLPPNAVRYNWLVLDATTGQNGLQQATVFRQSASLTGIVLTKLDGTAKGGVVLSIAHQLGLPVQWVGVGEGIDDLMPFNPHEFAQGLCGLAHK